MGGTVALGRSDCAGAGEAALVHSAVRELSRVAVPETEAERLEAASGKNLRLLLRPRVIPRLTSSAA